MYSLPIYTPPNSLILLKSKQTLKQSTHVVHVVSFFFQIKSSNSIDSTCHYWWQAWIKEPWYIYKEWSSQRNAWLLDKAVAPNVLVSWLDSNEAVFSLFPWFFWGSRRERQVRETWTQKGIYWVGFQRSLKDEWLQEELDPVTGTLFILQLCFMSFTWQQTGFWELWS